MIYVTGDTHGDLSRFKEKAIRKLGRGDTLIVCGDFGFLWDGSKREQRALRWLSKRRYRILFLEGTHDNLSLLTGYPITDFAGGKARKLADNLYHLVRGHIFTLEDKKLFVFGGGESPDHDQRREGKTWWPAELAGVDEICAAMDRLEEAHMQVDYILTHDCAGKIKSFIDMDNSRLNHLNTFFDGVMAKATYKMWFFGCYHLDKLIPPSQTAVYRNVIALQ
jgi:hypothetical protein